MFLSRFPFWDKTTLHHFSKFNQPPHPTSLCKVHESTSCRYKSRIFTQKPSHLLIILHVSSNWIRTENHKPHTQNSSTMGTIDFITSTPIHTQLPWLNPNPDQMRKCWIPYCQALEFTNQYSTDFAYSTQLISHSSRLPFVIRYCHDLLGFFMTALLVEGS